MPKNTSSIFTVLMKIAAFELLPTEYLYENIFHSNADGGHPVNENFEKLGFGHHLLFNNFGTLGFVLILFPFFYIIYSIFY